LLRLGGPPGRREDWRVISACWAVIMRWVLAMGGIGAGG
jgi:hypothetical protein